MDVNAAARRQAVAPLDTPIAASLNAPPLKLGDGAGPTPGISGSNTAPQPAAPEAKQKPKPTLEQTTDAAIFDSYYRAYKSIEDYRNERDRLPGRLAEIEDSKVIISSKKLAQKVDAQRAVKLLRDTAERDADENLKFQASVSDSRLKEAKMAGERLEKAYEADKPAAKEKYEAALEAWIISLDRVIAAWRLRKEIGA